MARTLNVVYNPLSFEEVNQPLMAQTQFHYAMLDQLDEQMEKGAILNNLKYSDMDSAEYQNFLNYQNKISELSNAINERGASASDKGLMRGLRQIYANDIVPMEQAYLRRAEEQKMLREAQMKDPDLLVGNNPSMTGLKSYLDPNFTGLNQTMSGKDITNEVSALTKQLANDLVNVSNLGALEGTHDTLIKIWKKKGFSSSDILRFANGDTSGKNAEMFNDVVNLVLNSKGITSWDTWNNQDFRDRVYEYANKGLYAGIGESDITIQQDPFAVAALKKKSSGTHKEPNPAVMRDRTIEYNNAVLEDYGLKDVNELYQYLGVGASGNMSTKSFWNLDGSSRSIEEYQKFAPKERKESGVLAYTHNPNGKKLTLPDSVVNEKDLSNYTKAGELIQKIGVEKRDFDEWSKWMQATKKKAEGDKFKEYTQQELWGMYNSPNSMQFGVYSAKDVINRIKELDSEGKFSKKMNTKMFEIPLSTVGEDSLINTVSTVLRNSNGKNLNLTPVTKVGVDGVFEKGKDDVVKASDYIDDKGNFKGNIKAFFSMKPGNEGLYLNIDGKTFRAGDNAISETSRAIIKEATESYEFYGNTVKDVEKAARGDKKALERCRAFAKLIDESTGTNQLSTLDDKYMLAYVAEIAKNEARKQYSTVFDTYVEDLSAQASGRSYRVGSTQTVNNEEDED
jgi:hypothetical protein